MHCALSGGADSTALVILAVAAGCRVTAHHVDHGIRPTSADDADQARSTAARLGVGFVLHRHRVDPGPNLEARARQLRAAVLPDRVMTGHTAEDQAETVLLRLLRGSGATGLAAMTPDHRHPIIGVRRAETEALCRALRFDWAEDETNAEHRFARNRVRHELLPLLTSIARRDPVPLITRTADLLRDDDILLTALATELDPTDADAVAAAPPPLARRALRAWLSVAGYPPDAASVERVLAVARHEAVGCELPGGRRIRRRNGRLRVEDSDR